ncbi:hypothetical protein J2W42_003340 [Rhizobium tibeticum]|nr:hypothetical protein [Rhizobium tibeticum]
MTLALMVAGHDRPAQVEAMIWSSIAVMGLSAIALRHSILPQGRCPVVLPVWQSRNRAGTFMEGMRYG